MSPSDGDPLSRRAFVRRAGVALGGLAAGGALAAGAPRLATSAPSFSHNIEILNFALLVEEAQAGLYAAALRQGRLSGALRTFAERAGADERAHVALLRRLLAGAVQARRPKLRFDAGRWDARAFAETAVALENSATRSAIGQGGNLTPDVVTSLARITAVDARHAAWILSITGGNPAPRAQDAAETPEQTLATLRELGLLAS